MFVHIQGKLKGSFLFKSFPNWYNYGDSTHVQLSDASRYSILIATGYESKFWLTLIYFCHSASPKLCVLNLDIDSRDYALFLIDGPLRRLFWAVYWRAHHGWPSCLRTSTKT